LKYAIGRANLLRGPAPPHKLYSSRITTKQKCSNIILFRKLIKFFIQKFSEKLMIIVCFGVVGCFVAVPGFVVLVLTGIEYPHLILLISEHASALLILHSEPS